MKTITAIALAALLIGCEDKEAKEKADAVRVEKLAKIHAQARVDDLERPYLIKLLDIKRELVQIGRQKVAASTTPAEVALAMEDLRIANEELKETEAQIHKIDQRFK